MNYFASPCSSGVRHQQRRTSQARNHWRSHRRSTLMTVLDMSTDQPLLPAAASNAGEVPHIQVSDTDDISSEVKKIPGITKSALKADPITEESDGENKTKVGKTLSIEDGDANLTKKRASFSTEPLPALRRHSRIPPARRNTLVNEGGSLAPTIASQRSVGNERAQEKRLTRISISIVWLFLFCHCWKLIPTIYESLLSEDGMDHDNWPFVVIVIEHLSHMLITLNSAINFLIYLVL